MPNKKKILPKTQEAFGPRLARLRLAAGYSQRALAAEIGISQRMVAYYEKQTLFPPTHLLPLFAHALGVSADEFLGMAQIKPRTGNRDARLWRRFNDVSKLPPNIRSQIVQIIDAFLEREKLKKLKSA
jgi:transcriptional regulator with XRE-family HTH domain